jgi:hypothetical protein
MEVTSLMKICQLIHTLSRRDRYTDKHMYAHIHEHDSTICLSSVIGQGKETKMHKEPFL